MSDMIEQTLDNQTRQEEADPVTRIFVVDGKDTPDPDPKMSPEDVRKMWSEWLPKLANADVVEEKTEGGVVRYRFNPRIGTKGVSLTPSRAAEIIAGVPEKRLRVFDLAGALLDERGELNPVAAVVTESELNLAEAEAKAYAQITQRARQALEALAAR